MKVTNQIFKNPIYQALQIIGDRWTIYILRDAFLGRHRFNEFIKYSVKSKVTLINRLNWLIENDILYKSQYIDKPPRHEYKLTPKGLELYPWALTIWQWESTWAKHNDPNIPTNLVHNHETLHPLNPLIVCRACSEVLHYEDIKVQKLEDTRNNDYVNINTAIHRRTKVVKVDAQDKSLSHIVDIIGDRWSSLILAACFLGIKRFDDFERELNIATNILTDRLKKLTKLEVVIRKKYQDTPDRFEYLLSDKGKALYSQTLALRQWAIDNFKQVETDLNLIHVQCGAQLNIDIICQYCKEQPNPSNVSFQSRS